MMTYKNTTIKQPQMKPTDLKNRMFISFSQLVFDSANREVGRKQVETLKQSVVLYGVLRPVVVVFMNGKKIIVDGQHLATALFELKLPIECAVVPCANHDEKIQLMSYLNRIANAWTLADYIHANKDLGKKDYVAISSILSGAKIVSKGNKKLKVQDCLLFAVYSQKNRGVAKDEIKEGNFRIADRKAGDKLIQQIYDCQRAGLPSNSRKVNEYLISLINDQSKKGLYNHTKFITNIRKAGEIIFPDNDAQIKNELRKIYEGQTKSKKQLAMV